MSDWIKREDAVRVCEEHARLARENGPSYRAEQEGAEACAMKIRNLPASTPLTAREDALVEALFVFAYHGEQIRVGDFTIEEHRGDVADDDGWLVTRDVEMSGVCYADFDQAIHAALREQEQQQDGGPK
jgi:hypothetical protein